MAESNAFSKIVPGFEFLQGLMKNAGAALPSIGQWVAPTLNPDELDKRIDELRTVQFWLEQNARMLGVTIQALEVQRMTLSTLKTMNLPMADLRDALLMRTPAAESPAPAAAPAASPAEAKAPEPAAAPKPARKAAAEARADESKPAAGVVDPMQWWGALTKQFTELASNALKEGGVEAAKSLAGAMARPAVEAAGQLMPKPRAAKAAPAKKARAAPRKRAG